MAERNILFCDDHKTEKGYGYSPIKMAVEQIGGHRLHVFKGYENGIDECDIKAMVPAIRREMVEISCEGIIMDLKWHIDILGESNTLGLDILEEIVNGGILPPLSLDRIVLATIFSGNPIVEARFSKLNCPIDNVWEKSKIARDKPGFAKIFE